MPSLRSLLQSLSIGGLLSQIPFQESNSPPSESVSESTLDVPGTPFSTAPICPRDGPLSCQSADVEASCCFIAPGGQLLQTQFWDTKPAVGPEDSWTLHGLWPDLCDGTYDQFCHSAPQYHNITDILTAHEKHDLLAYMNSYWLPNSGTAERFWQHEWNKHGTCVNTLAPACYGEGYMPGAEVVDFFVRAVEVFKTLDTYAALAAADILPSTTQTYTAAQIRHALRGLAGHSHESSISDTSSKQNHRSSSIVAADVILGCTYAGELNQAWYSYNVRGSLQTGLFVPTPATGKAGRGSCPKEGIRYLPKGGG